MWLVSIGLNATPLVSIQLLYAVIFTIPITFCDSTYLSSLYTDKVMFPPATNPGPMFKIFEFNPVDQSAAGRISLFINLNAIYGILL